LNGSVDPSPLNQLHHTKAPRTAEDSGDNDNEDVEVEVEAEAREEGRAEAETRQDIEEYIQGAQEILNRLID